MQYLELTLPTVAENLALDEALLEDAQSQPTAPEVLRVWQAASPFIVLGRSSRVAAEVERSLAEQAAVPIFRRVSGGATIVAGRGCMFYALLLSLERRPHLRMLDQAHLTVMTGLQQALKPLVPEIELDGTCDLVLQGKKASGNSVRLVRDWMLYHGTILLDMDLSLPERLLKHPPREPEYRRGRVHRDFLTNLQLPYPDVAEALRVTWKANDTIHNIPTRRVADLVRDKYLQSSWNLLR